ncbi:hypothetical protein [Massilia sp.]|uniref:hypothetical protein n=1 Tax=Massilia sp. TaxID=1882437 RepID=UPI0028AA91DF|nr:hypothetical protein [Massilia sp.]
MKRICALGALAACMQPALAVDIKTGDWTVNVGGNVNAYYTFVDCDGGEVGGLALAGQALGCAGKDRRTTIGNGLLPSALVTSATTNKGGYDVNALISIYVHAATDSAIAQNSEVDVRQAYFSFGNAGLGTFKLGRDHGIFGANAILNDMTLLGAGAPVQATQRGRVALGHIGAGYAYFGHYGQIAYTSPLLDSGVTVDVGVMSPVDDTPVIAGSAYSADSTPQFQAQVTMTVGEIKGSARNRSASTRRRRERPTSPCAASRRGCFTSPVRSASCSTCSVAGDSASWPMPTRAGCAPPMCWHRAPGSSPRNSSWASAMGRAGMPTTPWARAG